MNHKQRDMPKTIERAIQHFTSDPKLPSYKHEIDPIAAYHQFKLFNNQFAYIIDAAETKVVYLSENFAHITGHDEKEFNINFWINIIHPDDRPFYIKITEALYHWAWKVLPYRENFDFTTQGFFTYTEFRIRKKNEEYIKISRQTSALTKDKMNFPIHTLGVCTDLTGISTSNHIPFHVNTPDRDDLIKKIFGHQDILSHRQIEMVQFMAAGKSSKEISTLLNISSHTVDTHRRNILNKLKVKNTAELMVKVFSGHWKM